MSWRDIPDTELSEDKFLAASTLRDLRDNIPALAEGAPGAPRIQTAALADSAVTAPKLASGAGERDWVLARTAAASAGAVGTYAMLAKRTTGSYTEGQTAAGSALFWASAEEEGGPGNTPSPAGAWRCMGRARTSALVGVESIYIATVWLRIS